MIYGGTYQVFCEFSDQPTMKISTADDEHRKCTSFFVQCSIGAFHENIIGRFSSLQKLLGIVALCIRFTVNRKLRKNQHLFKSFVLEASGIEDAENRIIMLIQESVYLEEFKQLKQNKNISMSNKLIK